jgi:hypothetical protein
MRRRNLESLPGLIGYEMRRLWSSDLEALCGGVSGRIVKELC